jgi:hypothetical protein
LDHFSGSGSVYIVKKGYTPEQIINKLREAEVLLSQGATLALMLKKTGVSDVTYVPRGSHEQVSLFYCVLLYRRRVHRAKYLKWFLAGIGT